MKTLVSVQKTTITYYCPKTNTGKTIEVVGDLNITQCKTYLKENELGTYIDRKVERDIFEVSTVELLKLKEV